MIDNKTSFRRLAVYAVAIALAVAAGFTVYAQGNRPPASLPPAITDLQNALAATNARLDKLEGNITDVDLFGTYQISLLILDLDAPPAGVQVGGGVGSMTLGSDNMGTADFSGTGIDLAEGTPWTSGVFDIPSEGVIDVTWGYNNGILHVDDGTGNFDVFLNVGVGGRILTFSGLSDDNTIDLIIMTRLQ